VAIRLPGGQPSRCFAQTTYQVPLATGGNTAARRSALPVLRTNHLPHSTRHRWQYGCPEVSPPGASHTPPLTTVPLATGGNTAARRSALPVLRTNHLPHSSRHRWQCGCPEVSPPGASHKPLTTFLSPPVAIRLPGGQPSRCFAHAIRREIEECHLPTPLWVGSALTMNPCASNSSRSMQTSR
jgi:hypothetical protein